jgi:RecB family exonuclease
MRLLPSSSTLSCFLVGNVRRRRGAVSYTLDPWSGGRGLGMAVRANIHGMISGSMSQRSIGISTQHYISDKHRGLNPKSFRWASFATSQVNNDTDEINCSDVEQMGVDEKEPLLDLETLLGSSGKLPMPKSLSPSSASEFRECPQSYLFQYLLKMRQPTNEALAKGSMVHAALEKIFDAPQGHRTLKSLHDLLRSEWAKVRDNDTYSILFRNSGDNEDRGEDGEGGSDTLIDLEAERKWGEEALRLLDNYVELEDPREVKAPNPLRREVWVMSKLDTHPGEKMEEMSRQGNDEHTQSDQFLVRGIVDRLDLTFVNDAGGNGDTGVLRVTDYKTGKAPTFKYSSHVNERIAEEKFWQLKVYALLLREMARNKKGRLPNYPVRFLRLLFLTSENQKAQYLEMDLGETQEERNAELQPIHDDLANAWSSIQSLVEKQDLNVFVHCDRSFCWCHKVRPRIQSGVVWERPNPGT